MNIDNRRSWKSFRVHRRGLAGLVFTSLLLAGSCGVEAQTFDNSANGAIKGPYYVRQLLTQANNQTGAITRAVSLIGTMTFDGNGGYSFTGQMLDSTVGTTAKAYSTSGTYSAAANGLIGLTNPVDANDNDYGGVGTLGPGVIVASATEGQYDDIFIAIPAGSTSPTNSTLQGTYRTGFLEFLDANASQVRDGYYTLTSTGGGSLGTVSVTGGMANSGNNTATQTYSNVAYNAASGGFTFNFPAAADPTMSLISGQKAIYTSADGNIFMGGGINTFDMIVGAKAATSVTSSLYQGTYFNASLSNVFDASLGSTIASFYGSTLALGEGHTIFHERYVDFQTSAYDYTVDGFTNFASDGTNNDGVFQSMLGANGQALIQVGVPPFYSLLLGFKVQNSGTGVYINPQQVFNAGSFAPITNSVSPGEYVTIFGSGLSTAPATANLPFPQTLNNVGVTVNGRPAPVYYVSPTQINLLVPYATTEGFATFQVTNNNVKSNQVTVYNGNTSPGVFALTQNGGTFPAGIGPAAMEHLDYSLVTKDNPAKAGEILQLYLTGLGAVNGTLTDGAPVPTDKLYTVIAKIAVEIEDGNGNFYPATVSFAGMTPGVAGLYQINFTMPSGVPSGLQWVNVGTPDAYTSEAKIYVK